jgi:hypothetical protein
MSLLKRLSYAVFFWRNNELQVDPKTRSSLGDELHEPWRGRQHRPNDNPNDRPEGGKFATWEEAFNRRITDKLDFLIEYADRDGVVTERRIEPRSIHLIRNRPELYIRAFCHLRNSERNFHTARIHKCLNVQTNRQITDLGQHLRRKY